MAGFGGSVKLTGANQYKKDLKDIGQQLKIVSADMKATNAAFDKGDKSTAALQARQKSLNATLEVVAKKIKILATDYEDYAKRVEKSSEKHQKLQKEYDTQKAKLDQIERTLGNTSKEYKEQAEVVDKLEQELRKSSEAEEDNKKVLTEKQVALKKAQGEENKYKLELGKVEEQLDENIHHTKELEQATKEAAERAREAAQGGFTVFKGILANLATSAIQHAVSGLKSLASNVVEAGVGFDSAMSQVAAVSGATGKELDALTEKAKEMGAKTKFSASESAEAFNYMAMAGWKTEDMLGGIEGIMNLAAASGSDLATASDIVTDALTAMGYSAKDAGRLADVMAAASSNANTNVEMMGATFQYAAPIVGALGYNMEDTAVAIGLMANAGIKADKAGTALRSVLTRLSAPPSECSKAMEKLGISIKNTDGTMKPLSEVVETLRKKFNGLSAAEQTQYAKALAGQEAMSGLLAIVNAAPSDYDKLTKAVQNSSGAAEKMAETMQDNVGGQLTLLKSQLEGVYLTIWKKVEPTIKKAISSISKTLSKVDWNKFGEKAAQALQKVADGFNWIIKHRKAIVSAITAVLAAMAIKKVNDFTKSISNVGKGLLVMVADAKKAAVQQAATAASMKATTAAANGVANAAKTAASATSGLATAAGAATTASTGLKTATGLLSAAFRANPVGMVVTGVTAAVTAFGFLKKAIEASTEAHNANGKKVEKLKEDYNSLASSVEKNQKSRKEAISAIDEENAETSTLIRRLQTLEGIQDKTTSQKREMKAIVDKLNEVLPELNLNYDEEKDKLDKSTKSINDNIEAQKNLNKAKQEQENLAGITEDLASAEKDAAKAAQEHERITKDYLAAQRARKEFEEQWTPQQISMNAGLRNELARLITEEHKQKKAYEESQKVVEGYQETLKGLEGEYDETAKAAQDYLRKADMATAMEPLIAEMKKKGKEIPLSVTAGIEESRYAIPQSMAELQKLMKFDAAINEAGLAGQQIPERISQGVMNGKISVQEAINQVNEVIDLSERAQAAYNSGAAISEKLAEGIRNGTVSVKEANDALMAASTFTELSGKATETGQAIVGNLAEQVRNGTITVQDANQQLQAAINFDNAVKKAQEAGFEIPTDMAAQIAAGQLAPNEALQRVQALLDFTKSFNEAGVAGKAVPNALRQGILSGEMTVAEANNAMNNWIQFKKATKGAQEAGVTVPSELATNIISGNTTVAKAVEQMNNWVKFQKAIAGTEAAGKQIPKELQTEILNGKIPIEKAIEQINSAATKKADQLPGQMKTEGSKATGWWLEGLFGGLNNKGKKNNINKSAEGVGTGIQSALEGALDINSPSKKAETAGKYYLDGVYNGINNRDKRNNIFSKVASFGSSLLQKLKDALKEKSPSKATEEMGVNYVKGFENGVDGEKGNALTKVSNLGQDSVDSLIKASKKGTAKLATAATNMMDIFSTAMKTASKKVTATKDAGASIADGVIAGVKSRKGIAKKNADQLAKLYVSAAKSRVSELKKANKITEGEEVTFWEKILKTCKKGSEGYKSAAAQLATAKKNLKADVKEVTETYIKGIAEVNSKMEEDIAKLEEEYSKAVAERQKAIVSSMGLFDEVKLNAALTTDTIIKNLQDQVDALAQWDETLDRLRARLGGNSSLLAELEAAGVSSLGTLQAISEMSDEELQTYIDLYNQKQNIARERAETEYQELRRTTDEQIAKLRKDAKAQINKLTATYKAELKKMGAAARNSAKSVGTNIAAGIKAGLDAQMPAIRADLMRQVREMVAAAQKALKIRSPSRVFRDEVGKMMAAGIGVGFDDQMQEVKDKMRTTLQNATLGLADTSMAGTLASTIAGNAGGSVAQANAGENSQMNAVDALMQALERVKIELDDERMGRFIDKTVTNKVYN